MFNRKKFHSVNAQIMGTDLINEWKYVTSDSSSEVESSDYFQEVQKLLSEGDVIHVYFVSRDADGNDTSFLSYQDDIVVRMSPPESGHVSTLSIFPLSGQCLLKNTEVGDAAVISMSENFTVVEAFCILSGRVRSVDDSNTITVKNGATTLFTGVINNATADGSVIAMTKNEEAGAGLFSAAAFDVENDGGASVAHGIVAVILNANIKTA